jgi:hypothetical protein
MLQTFLLDVVAAAALIGIAFVLRKMVRSTVAFYAGITAGAVSFVQAAIGETIAFRAGEASASSVRTLFVTLNDADTVKIALISAMIAASAIAARRSATVPRWLTTGSLVFAPILAFSGLAFPTEQRRALRSALRDPPGPARVGGGDEHHARPPGPSSCVRRRRRGHGVRAGKASRCCALT